jgi:fatty acid-binding protein DegV
MAKGNMINGQVYGELVRAGFIHLSRNYQHLNNINVFPIPDGDTGNNMVITTLPAVVAITGKPDMDLLKVAQTVAGQAAVASQGNSGTIFGYFFNSLAENIGKIPDAHCLNVKQFAKCLKASGETIGQSMSNPVPGTMISVIKDAFARADAKGDDDTGVPATVKELIDRVCHDADVSCKKTPEQLKVNGKLILKGRGVVDSGAQGFVNLLEGMRMALEGKLEYGDYFGPFLGAVEGDKAVEEKTETKEDVGGHDLEGEMEFRFCTECVAEIKAGVDADQIKALLSEKHVPLGKGAKVAPGNGALGNSMAVNVTNLSAESRLAKVHIHSNDPEEVYRRIGSMAKDGHCFKEKADDMSEQVQFASNPRDIPDLTAPNVVCGILWDSIHDMPQECYQVWKPRMVPIPIVVDTSQYMDRVELEARSLADMIRRRNFDTIGTAGCKRQTLESMFGKALNHGYGGQWKEFLLIKMPQSFSFASKTMVETVRNSEMFEADKHRINVWENKGACMGAVLMRAHWLAAQGKTAAEITADLDQWENHTGLCQAVMLNTITFLRNGGRFDQLEKKALGLLREVLNMVERKKLAMGALYMPSFRDPAKPDGAKAQLKGFAKPDKLMPKMCGIIAKVAAKSKAKEFDCMVSHWAQPWRAVQVLDELEKCVAKLGGKIRNKYIGEDSATFMAQTGDKGLRFTIWPADDFQFAHKGKGAGGPARAQSTELTVVETKDEGAGV